MPDRLPEIVELLRTTTTHDFTLYKPGTLQRRVERRMAIASIALDDTDRYVQMLHADPVEVERLAKDLLIHVTSFFRDPAVFAVLDSARTIFDNHLIDMQEMAAPERGEELDRARRATPPEGARVDG